MFQDIQKVVQDQEKTTMQLDKVTEDVVIMKMNRVALK
jgi:hypothetical protein